VSDSTVPAEQNHERSEAGADHPDPMRWWILTVLAIAQLMIVLDASIVNIALPSAQEDLGISDADRQWIVTAYTLAFGGLLLLGGRIADYTGRKRAFVIGLLGFAAASALGGAATNAEMLFGARAVQGVFGALMAPAALSLLTVTFTEEKERARAFGVYGAIAGGGTAIGLIMGGVLTQYASWRWTLLVNVPIAVVAAFFATRVLTESKAHGNTKYDIPGALTSTAGLAALVYGFNKANTDGWGSTTSGAPARQSAWNGGPNQQWQITDLGHGRYRIANRTTGLVLDGGGQVASGSVTKQWSPVDSPNLQWTFQPQS